MKIKDLIKHLETLDQEKQLVIIGVDPTDWEYGSVVNEDSIQEETVYPCEDNGLLNELGENHTDVECYVIRIDC
jgi:hypothetical protein